MISAMSFALGRRRRIYDVGIQQSLQSCVISVFLAALQMRLIYMTPGLGNINLVRRCDILSLPAEYDAENVRKLFQEIVFFQAVLFGRGFIPGSLTGDADISTAQRKTRARTDRARSI